MEVENKLLQNLALSERNIVIIMYKNYDNYVKFKYKVNPDEFTNTEYKQLYKLAELLYDKYKYNTLSIEDVKLILKNRNFTEVELSNFEFNLALIQLDVELDVEGSIMRYLKDIGLYKLYKSLTSQGGSFDGFIDYLENIEQDPYKIKDFLTFILDESFNIVNNKIKESDFTEGSDEVFDNIIEGKMEQGLRLINNYCLNYLTKGFHKGVTFFGGYSGTGKTTYCIPMFLLPVLEALDDNGGKPEKLLIIANEQDKEVFLVLLALSYVSFILRKTQPDLYEFVNRNHISENKLSQKEIETFKNIKVFIKEELKNRIHFIFMPSFKPQEIEHYILKYSRMGYKNVFVDTMKAETKGEYAMMSNLAQMLDRVSKENDLRVLATVQLAIHTMGRKYIDHTCIAEAKSIVEIAEVSLYFREATYDEVKSLNVFKFNPETKVYEDIQHTINPISIQERFILLFVGKNRHGADKKIILYRSNFDMVWFTEIGYVTGVAYDGGKF